MERLRRLKHAGQARRAVPRVGLHGGHAHSLSSRLRGIRDDAFHGLGDTNLGDLKVEERGPKFDHQDHDFTPAQNAVIRSRVEGTVEVPCYLDQPGCPAGSRSPRAKRPAGAHPGNVSRRQLHLQHPRSVTSATPGRLSLYGHGLFGSAGEVNSISQLQIASEHKVVLCASDWIGMSGGDVPTRSRSCRTCRPSRSWPTASSRLRQLPLPRARDDPPEGAQLEPGVLGCRRAADRHAQALLLRRQPGRYRGRGADRGRARLHARS